MKRIDTAWFKGLLAYKKISQRQLAIKMEMDPGSMSVMLNGKRPMRMREAEAMSVLLGTPVDEILYYAGLTSIRPSKGGERKE